MHDFAGDDATPRSKGWRKSRGNTETDQRPGSIGDGLTDQVCKSLRITATGNRLDPDRSFGNARLCTQACHGEYETWLPCHAHIPTRTEVVFAAFKLRYRANAQSGKNFA